MGERARGYNIIPDFVDAQRADIEFGIFLGMWLVGLSVCLATRWTPRSSAVACCYLSALLFGVALVSDAFEHRLQLPAPLGDALTQLLAAQLLVLFLALASASLARKLR